MDPYQEDLLGVVYDARVLVEAEYYLMGCNDADRIACSFSSVSLKDSYNRASLAADADQDHGDSTAKASLEAANLTVESTTTAAAAAQETPEFDAEDDRDVSLRRAGNGGPLDHDSAGPSNEVSVVTNQAVDTIKVLPARTAEKTVDRGNDLKVITAVRTLATVDQGTVERAKAQFEKTFPVENLGQWLEGHLDVDKEHLHGVLDAANLRLGALLSAQEENRPDLSTEQQKGAAANPPADRQKTGTISSSGEDQRSTKNSLPARIYGGISYWVNLLKETGEWESCATVETAADVEAAAVEATTAPENPASSVPGSFSSEKPPETGRGLSTSMQGMRLEEADQESELEQREDLSFPELDEEEQPGCYEIDEKALYRMGALLDKLGFLQDEEGQFELHPDTPPARSSRILFKNRSVGNQVRFYHSMPVGPFDDKGEPGHPGDGDARDSSAGAAPSKGAGAGATRPSARLNRYWSQRYRLFSRFDQGVRLDEESWYSVTPEAIAKHVANRCKCDVIVDAFCGVGGNTIQFAQTCNRVVAIDIDPEKLRMAKHNAKIYGVEDKIEFVQGDSLKLLPEMYGVDVVFLSPPWGGPGYTKRGNGVFDLKAGIPLDGYKVFDAALAATGNIAYYVPKNTEVHQLLSLAGPGGEVDVELNVLNNKSKAITAYFGNLVSFEYKPSIGKVTKKSISS